MIDVDPDNLMVTPDRISQAITPRTRAIIPVHYAGSPADLAPIYQLAEQRGIAIIEDAAHAVGTTYY
ncbi:DegT/DnrJ/EryC1/StrS family aminotransferase, partial [Bacillus subtilis]|uniref:DegT/DnrJ/EryC1/StrS family aminotransferase n=1 Tax=Bacillus subtilis TaxID=1423 RepID=UPI003263A208